MKQAVNALVLVCAMSFATPGHAFFGFGKKGKKKPQHFVVEMHLSGKYPDRKADFSLFSTEKKSYPRLLKRLRLIKKDKRVKAVLFRFGGLSVSFAKAEGIQRALRSLTKAGKRTFAVLQSSGMTDLVAAMGCQKVVMTPAGTLFMPGLRAERLYYKGLLDKLGLAADFVTVGAFKTAPEPFLRTTMSDAARKQTERLIGDLYEYMVSSIAKGRKLKPEVVKAAIDQGMLLPSAAKKVGLIDGVAYLHDLRKEAKKLVPVRPLRFVSDYGKVKRKPPTSIWSLLSLIFRRKKAPLDPSKPKIAVVYASGQINYGSPSGGFSNSDEGIWSNDMVKMLEKVRKMKNLRAVVLRIDSPGGSALASDIIWRKLEQLKKRVPLFVSMGSVAASGGYYIAMGADMIVAEPTTLTGSIGVFGGKLVMKQTMAKLGITVNAVSRGKHAGIFSTFSKFSKSERETMQKLLDQIYLIFTTKAAKGRKMKRTELLKYAGGQVWTGRQAKKHGLVDKLGSLNDTIKLVLKRTGLKARPQIVRFPRPKSFFESLQKMSAAPMKSSPYAMLKWMRQIVQLSPQHAQQLRPLLSSPMPVLMWSPMPRILLR